MNIWTFLKQTINDNKKAILLVVIDHLGSSPGQAGFKMAVTSDGKLYGSVGGGQSEFEMVERAKKILETKNPEIFLRNEVHQKNATENNSGMICSGEQWVAYYPVTINNLELVGTISDAVRNGQEGIIHFTQDGISFHENEKQKHSHKNRITSQTEWHLANLVGKGNEVYIFGAGHVGLALSRTMSALDFTIHIFDDRKDLNTLSDNNYADYSAIVDYNSVSHLVPEGESTFVVIMTFGHQSDEVVLRQLISKNLKYLGMMGSSKKVASIFKNLATEGISASELKKINAPIGIPIGSQTPAEIAISIAAKIIEVKNSKD
jgi:xanthine dehydrogenase accessory factor